jgi:hypothetical protein
MYHLLEAARTYQHTRAGAHGCVDIMKANSALLCKRPHKKLVHPEDRNVIAARQIAADLQLAADERGGSATRFPADLQLAADERGGSAAQIPADLSFGVSEDRSVGEKLRSSDMSL